MRKILENPYFNLVIRLALGGIFVLWSIGKIADSQAFVYEIHNFKMVPIPFLAIMALAMPWIELTCGLMLIAGVRVKANAAIIGGLLVVFIIAVATAMFRGLDISCGCSTENAQKVGLPKILEDLAMLAAAVYLVYFPSNKLSAEYLAVREARETA